MAIECLGIFRQQMLIVENSGLKFHFASEPAGGL